MKLGFKQSNVLNLSSLSFKLPLPHKWQRFVYHCQWQKTQARVVFTGHGKIDLFLELIHNYWLNYHFCRTEHKTGTTVVALLASNATEMGQLEQLHVYDIGINQHMNFYF